jgi:hypothetical protein
MNTIHGSSISEEDNLVGLAPKTREMTETVTELFSFCADDYYLSLIDWKDGHDKPCRIDISGFQTAGYGGHAIPRLQRRPMKNPLFINKMIGKYIFPFIPSIYAVPPRRTGNSYPREIPVPNAGRHSTTLKRACPIVDADQAVMGRTIRNAGSTGTAPCKRSPLLLPDSRAASLPGHREGFARARTMNTGTALPLGGIPCPDHACGATAGKNGGTYDR